MTATFPIPDIAHAAGIAAAKRILAMPKPASLSAAEIKSLIEDGRIQMAGTAPRPALHVTGGNG